MSNENLQVKTGYADIWRISWPIMLSSLANTVINFTDTAFLGRVGETELAASAIGGVYYFVLVMMGVAIGIGAQIMIARLAGENRPAEIGSIFDHSVVLLLLLAAVMVSFCYMAMPSLIFKIISDTTVAKAVIVYLNARSWGLFPMMILVATRCLYVGIGHTRIVGYTTVLMMVLNFILGYLLAFGHAGFPAWGIYGVGLASAFSETAAAAYAILYAMLRKPLQQFRLFKFKNIQLPVFSKMMYLSAPIVLQNFISMGAWFVFFVLIEKMGQHALAISNVVRTIYMLLMTPLWGFSQAANTMVSNIIGQQKNDEVMPLTGRIMVLGFLTSLVAVIFVAIYPEAVLNLITTNSSIIQDARTTIYIICAATLLISVGLILLSAVSGTGDTRAAMFIEILNISAYLAFVIICTQFIKTSVEVVWLSEIQYWSLMALFSYFYLRSNRWRARIGSAELN